MDGWQLVLGAAFANLFVYAVALGPLERFWAARPARAWLSASKRADLAFFFGQYLVWSGLALAVLTPIRDRLHPGTVSSPSVSGVFVAIGAVVLGDLSVYWFHRACHHFDLLWRFHAVHHSVEHLDWVAAHREHPLDGLLTQLAQNLPAMLLGVHFRWLAPLIVFRGAWAVFIHSNVALRLGPAGTLLGAPGLHREHHRLIRSDDARTTKNFANLAPYLDLLFGTYCAPSDPARIPLGIEENWPKGYFAQLAYPFYRWKRRGITTRRGSS